MGDVFCLVRGGLVDSLYAGWWAKDVVVLEEEVEGGNESRKLTKRGSGNGSRAPLHIT